MHLNPPTFAAGKCEAASESCFAGSGKEKRNEVLGLEKDRPGSPPAFPRRHHGHCRVSRLEYDEQSQFSRVSQIIN